jgi:hypothetical protein
MSNMVTNLSPKKIARIAGFLYLMYFVASIISDLLGHFAFGDAAVIVNNIIAHEWLSCIGFIIGLFSALLFLLTAWALYVLLKPVNKNLALLFLLLNSVGVAIQCFSMLGLFAGLLLLNGADYLKVFQTNQLQALAMLFANLYKNGFMIAQIFFGIWLFPLGYLFLKSKFIPKILGILLIIDCFAVLIWFFQFFFFTDYKVILYPCLVVSFIAEFSLTLWLLINGVNVEQWKRHSPESV